MYGIINKMGDIVTNPAGVICLIVGLVAGAGLFYLLVIPVHNYLKYRVVRACGARVSVSSGHLSLSPRVSFSFIGFISTIVLGMGFARPVYFELHGFRRPGVHTCFVSFTGLLVYFGSYLVSLCAFLILRSLEIFSITSHMQLPVSDRWYVYAYYIFFTMISYLRVYCMCSLLFNLIPFGSLDVSEMLYMFLPINWSDAIRNNQSFTNFLVVLFAFIVVGKPGGIIQTTAIDINRFFINVITSLF